MLTFNVFDATFEYNPEDPEPYRGGQRRLGPGEITVFSAGSDGAHRTVNRTHETVRVLMWGDADPVGYSCYPDSNKITHWTDSSNPDDNVRVRRGQNLDHWDGELS